MENFITKVTLQEYNNNYLGYEEVKKLSSKEDVATFIDTFEKSGLKGYNIVKVLHRDGKYIFVYSQEEIGYDFFKELNKLCNLKIKVTSQNVKLLFDKRYSRGYYTNTEKNSNGVYTGDCSDRVAPDEAPTGFMGDDDVSELEEFKNQGTENVLLHVSRGVRLPINDMHGVTIGRSSAQSEYVVDNTRVSRKHARVYKNGNKYMVQDCNSANGTYIDGLKVGPDIDRELLVGSMLVLGNEEFRLIHKA